MDQFDVYAIRRISDKAYLPARKNGRGFSFDEPTADTFPRLFQNERSAKAALSAWLRGIWDDPVYDHDEWSHSDIKTGATPRKVDGRNPEDMQIVRFSLSEVI